MQTIDRSGSFTLGDRDVRRMGYGAMQLAGPHVFGPPKDRAAPLAVLREAVAAGVNHIDTSDFYGPHVVNQLIREALAPYRDDLVIVTKVGAVRVAGCLLESRRLARRAAARGRGESAPSGTSPAGGGQLPRHARRRQPGPHRGLDRGAVRGARPVARGRADPPPRRQQRDRGTSGGGEKHRAGRLRAEPV